jgi:hypothetical protein
MPIFLADQHRAVIAGSNRLSDLNLVGVRRYTLFLQSRCEYAYGDHETSASGGGRTFGHSRKCLRVNALPRLPLVSLG